MNFLTFLEATIKLGIPMIVLSWIIFTRLYGGGELDRKADKKSIGAQVKDMKKSFKKKKEGGNSVRMTMRARVRKEDVSNPECHFQRG